MDVRNLHEWDVEPSRAVEIQGRLRTRVSLKDSTNLRRLRWIGGADVSYSEGGGILYGGVVVLSYPDLEIVEEKWAKGKVSFPYIPGLLSFREAPIILKVFSLLRHCPDAVIFDGQGIAHPRGLGLASHIGLLLDLPSVGCAKTRLLGEHGPIGADKDSFAWLTYQGKRVGTVLRTRAGVKPVFVSPGHKMSLRNATKMVLLTCMGYRLPEPIRLAHQLVNRVRREGR